MITIPITEINSNPELAPKKHFGTFVKDSDFLFFESVEERELFMASLPVPEKVEEPIIVAAWQLRLQLTKMGLNTFVDDIINTMVDPELQMKVRVVWEYGNTIKSDSPLIEMMRHEMQLSKEEVREIFTIANNIEL